ncbi:MAG: redoxin domain-containing protein [Solobacterium sp.]|nr:redoxin domain-containing protein [Solobacterium sp.]
MDYTISAYSLFVEGLLSFFSPCVLPLIPLYISYLTRDAREENEDGTYTYRRGRTFFLTLCFVLGICTVFFLAGLGSAALRNFFADHKTAMQVGGGVILILFGLVSLHVIEIPFLNRTYQKNMNLNGTMSCLKAWMMGFFFSFAWSPCIGPMLAHALVMASSADTASQGWMFIASYTLGFILMFLLLGLFTNTILNLLKKHRNIVQYTGTAAGIIVLVMGAYMLYQGFAGMRTAPDTYSQSEPAQEEASEGQPVTVDMYDFTLPTAEGKTIRLSGLKGKVVVLNFFETWCQYCNQELPTFQKIHETMDDVKVIIVTTPSVGSEGDAEYVVNYLRDKGITAEIAFDDKLAMTRTFAVTGYPMTYFINKDGEYTGYYPGYAPEEMLLEYIESLR